MKGIMRDYNFYIKFFLIILLFIVLSSCDGITPTSPVINSFTADSTTIDEGESVNLSWSVTDATSVSISQGIGPVALSGSTSVSPAETTTFTLTATNSADSSTATVTITVNAVIVEQTLTIQPGPEEGKDSYVSSLTPAFNYSANEYLSIGQSTFSTLGVQRANYVFESYTLRSFLQFDLNALPSDSVVGSAVLKLYQTAPLETSSFMIGVHQISQDWEESTITWNNQPAYLTASESTVTVPAFVTGWLSWDVTSLVQGWVNGSIANHGIALQKDSMIMEFIHIDCYSSNHAGNSALRPKLVITYYVP
ncbi:DNRLRE domain-containing protein [bacterium]|nr:DNRLRE domain-containing protein [bacterium]